MTANDSKNAESASGIHPSDASIRFYQGPTFSNLFKFLSLGRRQSIGQTRLHYFLRHKVPYLNRLKSIRSVRYAFCVPCSVKECERCIGRKSVGKTVFALRR